MLLPHRMKLRLSTKLFAGFLAISVLFAAVVLINYQLSRKVLRNSLRVEESQLRTEEATTLLRNIIDMETGFRGYMLVGNEAMLEPYHVGERNLLGRFVDLRQKMPPESPQRDRLERAQRLFQQWASYSHLMISEKREALRRNPDQVALEGLEHRMLAEGLTGKLLMDQIRSLFEGFEVDELEARTERREKLTDSIQQTRMLSISLTIIAITMGLVWATYISRLLAAAHRHDAGLIESRGGGQLSDATTG